MNRFSAIAAAVCLLSACVPVLAQTADEPPAIQSWAIRGQSTFVVQAHPAFRSPYEGPNSLGPSAAARETFDVTLFAGIRLWSGSEIWINPEIDQGFGLSDTLGVAGFVNAEDYKVGSRTPYLRVPRLFLRQTIDLGGERQRVDPDVNQLGGSQTANRLVLTLGKFGVVDLFDANPYAHDPRGDFLNWSVVDVGAFDYAADAWGFTYGAAAELYRGRWTARGGAFDLSQVPNGITLDPTFGQFQVVGELERRHEIAGQPGSLKVTAFESHARMGRFADAIQLAEATGQPADIAAVRQYRGRHGMSVNLAQQATRELGLFVKGGWASGDVEPFDFTDIDRTIAVGASLKGNHWGRSSDTWGMAGVFNGISRIHQQFFDAGGVGVLAGDGQLPHPGAEQIVETYYDVAVAPALRISVDYQFVNHPAYNRDRGPVSVGAVRIHVQL
ncbi:MAG: carbohydrate porin [Acidobacteriaceae bacterium]|jgi:high affinity Mn2+ porin|nr:carbohydrate porin [Acidobacteriaceae bacterium]